MTSLETNGREQLNEYLEKPLELDSGTLSTQVNLAATSLSTGGLSGAFIIKDNGNISIYDSAGRLAIFLGF
jgi:hypothetical protein